MAAAAAAGLMLCCLLHMSYFHLHKISTQKNLQAENESQIHRYNRNIIFPGDTERERERERDSGA
jgi:hypothetical protein